MTILVYSRTTDYRHDSIPAGVSALTDLAADLGQPLEVSEAADALEGRLDGYAAIVFLNTSGDVLTDTGRERFQSYVVGGGGFLGVHCAAATETGWPFYRTLIGAEFTGHPDVQPARLTITPGHPLTSGLPATVDRVDEWYNFAAPATDDVLIRVDESTYQGGTLGVDHPLAWCHQRLGGRVGYTALGHTSESYQEPFTRAHLRALLAWVTQASSR